MSRITLTKRQRQAIEQAWDKTEKCDFCGGLLAAKAIIAQPRVKCLADPDPGELDVAFLCYKCYVEINDVIKRRREVRRRELQTL